MGCSGYPQGLKKEDNSLAGQVVAVADVFDAMTSDRPYRTAVPVDEALSSLSERADTEFASRCVEGLNRAYRNGKIKTQKERDR